MSPVPSEAPRQANGGWRSLGLVGLYFALYFGFFFSQADNFLANLGVVPVRPTVLFFLAALPLLAAILLLPMLRDSGASPPAALRRRLGRLAGLLTAAGPILVPALFLAAVSLLSASHPGAHWRDGIKFIVFPLYNLLVLTVGLLLPLQTAIRRAYRPALQLAYTAMALSILADIVKPGLFADHAARAAGLPVDSNTAAFLLVVACGLLLDYRRPGIRGIALLAVTAGALLATLSRGGLVLFALLLAFIFINPLLLGRFSLSRGQLRMAALGGVALVVALALVVLAAAQGWGPFGRHSARQRIEALAGGRIVETSDSRFELLGHYLDAISQAPLVGRGAAFAASQPKGPHNYYLLVWVNQGLAGLAAYLALLAGGFFLFRRRGQLSGMLLVLLIAVQSLFSHTVLEARGIPLALGIVATMGTLGLQRSAPPPGEPEAAPAAAPAPGGPVR